MSDPNHHPDCPRCKGKGFYLRREEYGFYHDGSFGGNDWRDCTCDPWMSVERLPKAVDPTHPRNTVPHLAARQKGQNNE